MKKHTQKMESAMEALLQAAQAIQSLSNQEMPGAISPQPSCVRKRRRYSTHTIETSSECAEAPIVSNPPSRAKKRGQDQRQPKRRYRSDPSPEEDSTDQSPPPKRRRRNRRRPVNRPNAARRSSLSTFERERHESRSGRETGEGTESPETISPKAPQNKKTGNTAKHTHRNRVRTKEGGRRRKSSTHESTDDNTSDEMSDASQSTDRHKTFANFYAKTKWNKKESRKRHFDDAERNRTKRSYWDRHPKWQPSTHAEQCTKDQNTSQKPPAPKQPTTESSTADSEETRRLSLPEAHRPSLSGQDKMAAPQRRHTLPRVHSTPHPPKVPSMQSKPPPPPPRQIFTERDCQSAVKPPPPPPPFFPCVGILTGQRSPNDRPPCGRTIVPTLPHPEPLPPAEVHRANPENRRSSRGLAWNHREEAIMHKPRADKAWLQSGRDPRKPIYLRRPPSSDDSSTDEQYMGGDQMHRELPPPNIVNVVRAKSQIPSRRPIRDEPQEPRPQARPKAQTRSIETRRVAPRGPKPTPYSSNINVTFRGGSPPQYNKTLHLKYTAMVKDNPRKLRSRIRADIRFMKSHKFSNHRAINYNLYRSYSLSISELKDLFGATSLGDVIQMCTETVHDEQLFGSQDAQSSFLLHTDDEETGTNRPRNPNRTKCREQGPESSCPIPAEEAKAPGEQAEFTTPNRQKQRTVEQWRAPQASEYSGKPSNTGNMIEEKVQEMVEEIFGREMPHQQSEPDTQRQLPERRPPRLQATDPQKPDLQTPAPPYEYPPTTPKASTRPPPDPTPNQASTHPKERGAGKERTGQNTQHANPVMHQEMDSQNTNNSTQQKVQPHGPQATSRAHEDTQPAPQPQTVQACATKNNNGSDPPGIPDPQPLDLTSAHNDVSTTKLLKEKGSAHLAHSPLTDSPAPRDPRRISPQRYCPQPHNALEIDPPTTDSSSGLQQPIARTTDKKRDREEHSHDVECPIDATDNNYRTAEHLHLPRCSNLNPNVPQASAHYQQFAGDQTPQQTATRCGAKDTANEDLLNETQDGTNLNSQPKSSTPTKNTPARKKGVEDGIPKELRSLPLHSEQVVLRNPERFGDIQYNKQLDLIEINLNKIPTELTQDELKFAAQCEREGRTLRAKYQDINARDMVRCPLSSCRHSIINAKTLSQSVGVHFREKRNAPNTTFLITYTNKGKVHRIHHPDALNAEQAQKKGWVSVAQLDQANKPDADPQTARPQADTNLKTLRKDTGMGETRQHKPLTTMDRYPQLTITEMMLKIKQGPDISKQSSTTAAAPTDTAQHHENIIIPTDQSQPTSSSSVIAEANSATIHGTKLISSMTEKQKVDGSECLGGSQETRPNNDNDNNTTPEHATTTEPPGANTSTSVFEQGILDFTG